MAGESNPDRCRWAVWPIFLDMYTSQIFQRNTLCNLFFRSSEWLGWSEQGVGITLTGKETAEAREGGGGELPYETDVSLRGVNFGFWSRLGCSGQSANILSRKGLV